MSKTYTFIAEWNGGTFVDQISEHSIRAAMVMWVNNLDLTGLGSSDSERCNLVDNITHQEPILLYGMKNVWCVSPMLENEPLLTHIILTR